MKTITLPAYAKINLSLDVLGKQPDGYHQVKMVMQQVRLRDTVTVAWDDREEQRIQLRCSDEDLPTDQRNIAYRAAEIMVEAYGEHKKGCISIDIEKKIPTAAGLAGGSADGAAVLLSLTQLWDVAVSLSELMRMGERLGADVPFCIMGQVAANRRSLKIGEKQYASTCALAEGIGQLLTPLPPLDIQVLMSKPPIGVSTAAVYAGLQLDSTMQRPNTEQLIEGLKEHNLYKITANMVNLLETVTLSQHPEVADEKAAMQELGTAAAVLMSGSGPTIFALYTNKKKAKLAYEHMSKRNRQTYLTRTLTAK